MEKERKIEIEKKNDRNRETEPGPIGYQEGERAVAGRSVRARKSQLNILPQQHSWWGYL